jgi:hypothetical protein
MSRDVNLHLRLTAKENELLTHLSNLTRCSKSQVLRDLLHGATLMEAPPIDYFDLLREVRRVGVNLNQLTRYVNEKRFVDSWKWDEALAEIRAIEKKMNEAFTPQKGVRI